MKRYTYIIFITTLAAVCAQPTDGSAENRIGAPQRVSVSLLLLEAPSPAETTVDLLSVGTPVEHQSQLTYTFSSTPAVSLEPGRPQLLHRLLHRCINLCPLRREEV